MKHVCPAIVSVCCIFLGPNCNAQAIEVAISSPVDGQTVAGELIISGTSLNVETGRVSVSIDGGPFQLATGTDLWVFDWDTTGLADGPHSITAQARLCTTCSPAQESITVFVENQTGLFVSIITPSNGDDIIGTLVVDGASSEATEVSLQIDGGPFQLANGTDSWDVVIESGVFAEGQHTLRARAIDGIGGEVFDAVTITASDPSPGVQTITYSSSVDGEPMNAKLYVPQNFDPMADEIGLICHLHGGGGIGNISNDFQAQADEHNWIVIAPDGRHWGLADSAFCPDNPNAIGECNWCTSAAYVDNPFDARVGPGEQDIFDAIDWASDNFNIDQSRIYLTGFSMGGRGTYNIGLKNPDRFAAISPRGPAIDMFEIFVRRPEPAGCKAGMVSGDPSDAPFVDTMYSITSGRFLIENAYNLPVFHGHGTLDTTANNDPTHAPYLHGRHILMDTSWDGCHEDTNLCFGHTPTLSELHTRHPDGYDWAYMFTEVGHVTDPLWLWGAPLGSGREGVEDPQNPGNLIGLFDFFERHTLNPSPDTVVFKSYTDTHRNAYWSQIDISTPWLNIPGAIRATRDLITNTLDIELVRVATATFDLELAGLVITDSVTLTLTVSELVEPVYDPALDASGEPLTPGIILLGNFANLAGVSVIRDGLPLSDAMVAFDQGSITISPLSIISSTTLVISESVPCTADTNHDGALTPADFTAWIAAFNAMAPECDQNGDGSCTPADFTAWIANFNAGC